MSKILINGVERDMTPEEQTIHDNAVAQAETERTEAMAKLEAKRTLKASAKAKLIAGEALTEEEAGTIVL
jgi:hypothetical protein